MEDLVTEYEQTLALIRKSKRKCKNGTDREQWESMDGSVRYSLQSMSRYVKGHYIKPSTGCVLVDPYKLSAIAGTVDPIEKLFDEPTEQVSEMVLGLDLQFLSNGEWLALKLYHLDGWSYSEIAEHMGLHQGSVARYLKRARDKLMKHKGGGVQTAFLSAEAEQQEGSYMPGLFRKPQIRRQIKKEIFDCKGPNTAQTVLLPPEVPDGSNL